MARLISTAPTPDLHRPVIKLGIAILLVGLQPVLLFGIYHWHGASSTSTHTSAAMVSAVPSQNMQHPQELRRDRDIIPPDRGTPAYTVGSGSR